jgi:predicted Zn finger-like uncharacterized protein
MIVECPSCQSKFNLPDEKVKAAGTNVRCGVCKHVFTVPGPSAEDFPGFGAAGVDSPWPVTEELPGRVIKDQEQIPDNDLAGSGRTSFAEMASIEFGKPEKKPKVPGRSRRLAILVLGFLVLLAAAGGAAYYLGFWPFADKTPAKSAMEAPLPSSANEAQAPAQPKVDRTANLVFDKYMHYFVDNEKLGKLLVIEGKVVNNTGVDVGRIKIEANLLDASDNVVANKSFLAGPKASNFELRTLGQNDLESRMNSVQEVLLNNGDVKPGEDVPFMVVFTNPPDTIKNFSLRVIEAQDVAPQPGQTQAPASAQPQSLAQPQPQAQPQAPAPAQPQAQAPTSAKQP